MVAANAFPISVVPRYQNLRCLFPLAHTVVRRAMTYSPGMRADEARLSGCARSPACLFAHRGLTVPLHRRRLRVSESPRARGRTVLLGHHRISTSWPCPSVDSHPVPCLSAPASWRSSTRRQVTGRCRRSLPLSLSGLSQLGTVKPHPRLPWKG